jgi:hypothetical protein
VLHHVAHDCGHDGTGHGLLHSTSLREHAS